MDQQRLHLKSVAAPLVTVALFPVHLWCQEGLEEKEEGEGFRVSLLLVLSMKTLCQALSGSHSQVCDASSLSVASSDRCCWNKSTLAGGARHGNKTDSEADTTERAPVEHLFATC